MNQKTPVVKCFRLALRNGLCGLSAGGEKNTVREEKKIIQSSHYR